MLSHELGRLEQQDGEKWKYFFLIKRIIRERRSFLVEKRIRGVRHPTNEQEGKGFMDNLAKS